jgi:hypothetical protein
VDVPQPASSAAATRIVMSFMRTRFLSETKTPPRGFRDGIRVAWACFLRWYEPDQVRRVCGRATLSARSRSPEAVFSCPLTLAPTAARRRRRR